MQLCVVVGRLLGATKPVWMPLSVVRGVVGVNLGTEIGEATGSRPAGKHVICLPETEPNTK